MSWIKLKNTIGKVNRKFWTSVGPIALVITMFAPSVGVFAISPADLYSLNTDTEYYWSTQNCSQAGPNSSNGGTLDSWLQAVAIHESGNNPTANSGDGAYGKYQEIPSTWQGYAASFYPPAQQYATPNLAPEDVQDALAYLANIPNFKNFNGDPFWLAVNWYDPAFDQYYPNKNAPQLDTVPYGGNSQTLASYGNQISEAINSGSLNGTPLSSVKMSYNNAPDFQMYLLKDGGTPTATTTVATTSSSCGSETTSCTLLDNSQSVSGPDSKILCEAEKYNGIYYLYGAGHAGYTNFRANCPETAVSTAAAASSTANPGPCATDCSGLITVAVDAVYNQDFSYYVDASGQIQGNGSQYWQSIPLSQAQAGDIVTRDDHVEIFEYQSGGTVYSFGSHETGTKTSAVSNPASFWTAGAWRYDGPGSK